jgi:hypothetical protein
VTRSAIVVMLVACGAAPATSTTTEPTPAASAMPTACTSLDQFIVADAVKLPQHPCRDWLLATRGRVFGTGVAFSGTIVATTAARGAGLFVTCHHCGGGAHEHALLDPETAPPATMQVGDPQQFYLAYSLFAPLIPPSALDAKGNLTNILPRDDVAIGAISNHLYKLRGQIGIVPPPTITDGKLPLDDPHGIAASAEPWASAKLGAQVLLLGYPRDLPDHVFGGQLVASVGEVLDDATARARLARTQDESSIAYDPDVEFVVAARASSGMSGGGVFDAEGRFLGVMVRGTDAAVDGKHLTRVVRASFIRAQLQAALANADNALRAKVAPFLPAL